MDFPHQVEVEVSQYSVVVVVFAKTGSRLQMQSSSLTTGKGNRYADFCSLYLEISWLRTLTRFVLANTEALHDKIGQLAQRVRELEDALQEAHSRYSSERHQLLSDELLQIKRPLEREVDASPIERTTKVDQADAVDAMGHLERLGTSTHNHTRPYVLILITPTTQLLLQVGKPTPVRCELALKPLEFRMKRERWRRHRRTADRIRILKASELPWLSFAFPFAPPISKTTDSLRGAIYDLLPQQEVAQNFARIISDTQLGSPLGLSQGVYQGLALYRYEPITEVDFYERIYRPMYGAATSSEEPMTSHDLAVLCMVLALGSLLDLDKPIDVNEHSQLYQLGRAALSLDSVFEQQSIAAIQALSLTFGRPPSFALCHIDTKMPFEKTRNEKGDVEMTCMSMITSRGVDANEGNLDLVAAWKHRFASECQSHVQDQAFGARPISYKRIQELDKSVRDFYIPPSLQVPASWVSLEAMRWKGLRLS
ncbi:zinc cluster transcription factor [Salix suchowensis]|nr:zinc cluster transcription factor [Salix suchowensis]